MRHRGRVGLESNRGRIPRWQTHARARAAEALVTASSTTAPNEISSSWISRDRSHRNHDRLPLASGAYASTRSVATATCDVSDLRTLTCAYHYRSRSPAQPQL